MTTRPATGLTKAYWYLSTLEGGVPMTLPARQFRRSTPDVPAVEPTQKHFAAQIISTSAASAVDFVSIE